MVHRPQNGIVKVARQSSLKSKNKRNLQRFVYLFYLISPQIPFLCLPGMLVNNKLNSLIVSV